MIYILIAMKDLAYLRKRREKRKISISKFIIGLITRRRRRKRARKIIFVTHHHFSSTISKNLWSQSWDDGIERKKEREKRLRKINFTIVVVDDEPIRKYKLVLIVSNDREQKQRTTILKKVWCFISIKKIKEKRFFFLLFNCEVVVATTIKKNKKKNKWRWWIQQIGENF